MTAFYPTTNTMTPIRQRQTGTATVGLTSRATVVAQSGPMASSCV
jgi:hypothetical protein